MKAKKTTRDTAMTDAEIKEPFGHATFSRFALLAPFNENFRN